MPRVKEEKIVKSEAPATLRPFMFHGVKLNDRGKEAVGDCPFCGGANKFSVNVERGQWRCLVCNAGAEKGNGAMKGGNVYTFLRLLWGVGQRLLSTSSEYQAALIDLAEDRKLLSADTLEQWGVVPSPLTGEWLVPGYGLDRKLNNLYRYCLVEGRMRLLCTPEVGHHLHGLNLWNKGAENVMVCEGPWDAMALWETLRMTRMEDDGSLTLAAVPEASMLTSHNVVAVPGAGVFKEEWCKLFKDKKVSLLYDNDHPKVHPTTGQTIPPVGYESMKRVASLFAVCQEPPLTVSYLSWSMEGNDHEPELPDGYDVRDALSAAVCGDSVEERIVNLNNLLMLVSLTPQEWVQGIGLPSTVASGTPTMELLPCHSYDALSYSWSNAMQWIPGLDDGLVFLLSIVVSTKLRGDQLFGMLLGPASSGKTTIAEGVSVNRKYVLPKSTMRGFHSGYKSDAAGKEDHSLISLCQDKTLIIKDADTLLTAPNRDQILAEMRDVWDRSTAAHYRHGMNRDYQGLNITIVLCGTAGLRVLDASELGQRFLICEVMKGIDDDLEKLILGRKIDEVFGTNRAESNGKPEGQKAPALVEAMRMTGGYVEYLRANAVELAEAVHVSGDVKGAVSVMARFVAHSRARPSHKQDERKERELAARLGSQLARLALCTSMVLGTQAINDEVMRRVRKVCLDSASGKVLDLAGRLHKSGLGGEDATTLCLKVGDDPLKFKHLLRFLKDIRVAEDFTKSIGVLKSEPRWRLTQAFRALYEEVVDG